MILNGKPFNPGELRTRVTFYTVKIVKDAGGAQKNDWEFLDTVSVKWVNAHGQEAVQNNALKSTQRATVTRRYNPHVTPSTSLLLGSERWQVVSVDDIQNRHEYMELIVERAKGTVSL